MEKIQKRILNISLQNYKPHPKFLFGSIFPSPKSYIRNNKCLEKIWKEKKEKKSHTSLLD